MFGLIFSLFQNLNVDIIGSRSELYSYERKISNLYFLCNFYFNLNSITPIFKAFSVGTASSQKMNLLKLLNNFLGGLFRTLLSPSESLIFIRRLIKWQLKCLAYQGGFKRLFTIFSHFSVTTDQWNYMSVWQKSVT
jgi:hypothetical protein